MADKQPVKPPSPNARRLRTVVLIPGTSIYLGGKSYADFSLDAERHVYLRMWDIGGSCALQAINSDGAVIDEVELLWHRVSHRRVM